MPSRSPTHRAPGVQTYLERREIRARTRSPSRIYNRQWRRLRLAYLAHHPLCECGCGYPATVVDHKQPHNGNITMLMDWDNLQALTKSCHDKKTAAYDGGFGNPLR
ncbi:MAG TPA: HNH endonuclease signature motif containing protein [Xanthobacteraceae bacterium]